MYITELSIKRPVVAIVFSAILVIFGLLVFVFVGGGGVLWRGLCESFFGSKEI